MDIDVPAVDGDVLYLADLGAKSDFYDKRTNQIFENPTSISLFAAAARVIRKRLKRPVYLYSLTHGGGYSVARGIGYTNGAAEWEDRGGVLARRGSKNVRYSIRGEPPGNCAQPSPAHDAPSSSGRG